MESKEKMKTTAGKLKGNNRCTTRRSRTLELDDAANPLFEKAMIQKNAIKSFFLAKRMVREKHFEEKYKALFINYVMKNVADEDLPEELRQDVRNLKRVLHLYEDNLTRIAFFDVPELIKGVCQIEYDKKTDRHEIPVIKKYVLMGFRALGDITTRTSKLQAKKAYEKVRRYLLSEGRLPVIPAEQVTLDMFGIMDVEDRPDLLFFDGNGEKIEAVKICCRKPDVSQSGKKKDKSAMHSMELYSKWKYARECIEDEHPHEIVGSFYFLGRNDDKKDHFEDYFFAPKGNNVVSLQARVFSEKKEMEMNEAGITLPLSCETTLPKNFEPQFEEFREGELCSGDACEHCDYIDLCNYAEAPLCSAEEKAKKSVRDITLSNQQNQAVNFRKGVARINAVAGAGKTLCISLRTAFMLNSGIDPSEILLITFTNAGAQEMKERIEMYDEDLMTGSDMSKMFCTTFNSFGDHIIRNEYHRFGFTAEPRLIDDIERKEIITRLLDFNEINGLNYENFDLKGAGALPITEKAFFEIKKHRFSAYDIDEFMDVMAETIHMNHASQEYENLCKALLDLYEEYDNHLRMKNLIEYQDQEALLFDLLEQEPYYFEDNFNFKHIIIDEFQDTSDNQIELVKKLIDTSCFESLIVVGDDSQTIFEFRDAVTENIVNFFDILGKEGNDFYITENHRSTPEILDFANRLIRKNRSRVEKDLVATRDSGKPVEVQGFYTKAEELEYITDLVEKKLDEGFKPEDVAILAATRNELLAIAGALAEKGIETSLQCPEPMLENSRVKGIISYSKMLSDSSASKDILNYRNVLRGGHLLEDLSDEELVEMIAETREYISNFRNLSYFDKSKEFDRVIEELAQGDSVALNMVERLKRLQNVPEKQKYVEEFVRFGGDAVKREGRFSGVVLSTAHSSKGLEWPVIINSITKYDAAGYGSYTVEGKRRLLFVSSTRARDELYITGQYRVSGKTASGEYINNRFLEESYGILGKEFKPRTKKEEDELKKAQKKKAEEEKAAEAVKKAAKATA